MRVFFIADIPLGTSIVEVSAIGFMSQKHELTFKEGVPINLDFTLEVANDRLNEIVISGTSGSLFLSSRESCGR